MENLKIWEQVEKSEAKHVKKVSYGAFKFNSICAYSQMKKATELWGPMGHRWGVKGENFDIHKISEGFYYCLYTAELYYPVDLSKGFNGDLFISSDIEIYNVGKDKKKYNDDWSKKVSTDALTKGLSKLGFNADVFMGKFDGKYQEETGAQVKDAVSKIIAYIEHHKKVFTNNEIVQYTKIVCNETNLNKLRKLYTDIAKLIKERESDESNSNDTSQDGIY